MNRSRYARSRAVVAAQRARDTRQLIWSGLLVVVLVVLYATEWWLTVSDWASDLIIDQIERIAETRPE